MPYKSDRIAIKNPKLDKRVKLTPKQKEKVIALYPALSQRELARRFGVSRRTIQFILDPNKLKQNLKRREERGGWEQYYTKEKQSLYMKNHRRRKHELFKEGLIHAEII